MQADRHPIQPAEHRDSTRQRLDLEAKLLAYRCGWLSFDEIKIRKLERQLKQLLESAGDDQMARNLINRC